MDDVRDIAHRPEHTGLAEEAAHPPAVDFLHGLGGPHRQVTGTLGLAPQGEVLLDCHYFPGGHLLGDVGQAETAVPLCLSKQKAVALSCLQHGSDGELVGLCAPMDLPAALGAEVHTR